MKIDLARICVYSSLIVFSKGKEIKLYGFDNVTLKTVVLSEDKFKELADKYRYDMYSLSRAIWKFDDMETKETEYNKQVYKILMENGCE